MKRYALLLTCLLVLALALIGCSRPSQTAEEPNPATQTDQAPGQDQATSQDQAPHGMKTRTASRDAAAKPQAAVPVVVPEGTELTVRLAETVGSKASQTGDAFSATVSSPVHVNGALAIPEGSEVSGHVAEAAPLGRFKGGARLRLALDNVSVKGKSYPLSAGLTRTAKGKGKRTAVMAGGGAGLGALIGGLAGGGKGAAIGALAGGGAGTAGAAFTGNKNIVIPAESALTFRLQKPVEIR